MKRRNPAIEHRAIVSICDSASGIRNALLGKLTTDHFGFDSTREIFERLRSGYLGSGKDIPSTRVFLQDPALSDRARIFLRQGLGKKDIKHRERIRSLRDVDPLVERLITYRNQRSLYNLARVVGEGIAEDHPDHDRILSEVEKQVLSVRSTNGGVIHHTGIGTNDEDVFKSILSDESGNELIPTGFETFDANSGGIARTNIAFWVSNYGGGKSITGQQLAINAYRRGYNALWVSIEMDEIESWERVWSNVSGVEHELIRLKKLTPDHKSKIRKARKRFIEHGKKRNCRFSIYHPGYIDPWQLLSEIRAYSYDVIVIDYIGLMKPPPGTPNEERIQLGEIAKVFKIIAGKRYLNAVLHILAQLNDDDKIKYSRAMAEHANHVLWWRRGEREIELHKYKIKQDKARNARLYDIWAEEDFAHMTVRDGGLVSEQKSEHIQRGKRKAKTPAPVRDSKQSDRQARERKRGNTERKDSNKSNNRRQAMRELTII